MRSVHARVVVDLDGWGQLDSKGVLTYTPLIDVCFGRLADHHRERGGGSSKGGRSTLDSRLLLLAAAAQKRAEQQR